MNGDLIKKIVIEITNFTNEILSKEKLFLSQLDVE